MRLALALAAIAHGNTVSWPTFTVEPERVHLSVRIRAADLSDVVDFGGGLARDPAKSPPAIAEAAVRAQRDRIARLVLEGVTVEADGRALVGEANDLLVTMTPAAPGGAPRVREIELRVTFEAGRPIERVRLRYELIASHDPHHVGIGKVRIRSDEQPFVFRAGTAFEADLTDRSRPSVLPGLGGFLMLGIDHILSGFDHLLFLAALLLASRRLRDALATVTGFTAGHCATLAPAAVGWLSLPSGVVEPAIALSIVYVGVENLAARPRAGRWRLAFLFGLVHGLGLAGAVREVGLTPGKVVASLASFHVGVEGGQALVAALVFPLLAWWRERDPDSYERLALRAGSLAIAAAGGAWLVARVTG